VRPFTVAATPTVAPNVTIRDLSITGGDGKGGAYADHGGGVLAWRPGPSSLSPTLTLERVRVFGNTVSTGAKTIIGGGGVEVQGEGSRLFVRESLITGNKALGTGEAQAAGAGISTFSKATANIENSTIAGNEAKAGGALTTSAAGGGLSLFGGSSVTSSTVYGNVATRTPGGNGSPSVGGNIRTIGEGVVTLRDTIIAGGVADDTVFADCSVGNNPEPSAPGFGQGGNVLPPGCGPGPGDRIATDPLLGALADNDGPTDTMAPLAGSPAIDAGVGCPPPSTDQRGLPRPSGPACDAGAFEVQPLTVRLIPIAEAAPVCHGKRATIVGTGGRDRLNGSKGPDVIAALAGPDTVLGRGGNDIVCGGAGKDVLKGGSGKDRLYGEGGADQLQGGPSRDKLVGGRGKDHARQ